MQARGKVMAPQGPQARTAEAITLRLLAVSTRALVFNAETRVKVTPNVALSRTQRRGGTYE